MKDPMYEYKIRAAIKAGTLKLSDYKFREANIHIDGSLVFDAIRAGTLKLSDKEYRESKIPADDDVMVLEAIKAGTLKLSDKEFPESKKPISDYMILAAIPHDPDALKYASRLLKRDEAFVEKVRALGGNVEQYIVEEKKSISVRKFREMNEYEVLDALRKGTLPLIDLYEEGTHITVGHILAATPHDPKSLAYATTEMKKNPDFIKAVIDNGGEVEQFLNEAMKNEMKKNHDFIKTVKDNGGEVEQFLNEAMNEYEVLDAVRKGTLFLSDLYEQKIPITVGHILAATPHNPKSLAYATAEMKKNLDFIKAVRYNGGEVEQFLNEAMKKESVFQDIENGIYQPKQREFSRPGIVWSIHDNDNNINNIRLIQTTYSNTTTQQSFTFDQVLEKIDAEEKHDQRTWPQHYPLALMTYDSYVKEHLAELINTEVRSIEEKRKAQGLDTYDIQLDTNKVREALNTLSAIYVMSDAFMLAVNQIYNDEVHARDKKAKIEYRPEPKSETIHKPEPDTFTPSM